MINAKKSKEILAVNRITQEDIYNLSLPKVKNTSSKDLKNLFINSRKKSKSKFNYSQNMNRDIIG